MRNMNPISPGRRSLSDYIAIARTGYRALRWPVVALILVAIRHYGAAHPQFIETEYSRGLYPLIQMLLHWTIGQVPIAGFYLFWIFVLFQLVREILRWRKRRKRLLHQRVLAVIAILARWSSALVIWFLVIWGFNYVRVPMHEQLGYTLQSPDTATLAQELRVITAQLISDRATLTQDTTPYIPRMRFEELADGTSDALRTTLATMGYPHEQPVRVAGLPAGMLLRLQTSGIYWFFVGESYIDAGLHPLQVPFTVAHEQAHGFGFGDEGVCNFLAYEACRRSPDAYIRYAGTLTYWRYVAAAFRRMSPDAYPALRDSLLTAGLRSDLSAIQANNERFTPIMPRLRDRTYNAYLQSQLNEGLESYDKVVLYSLARQRLEATVQE